MDENQQNLIVWAEIPVTDMQNSADYYGKLLEATLTIDESGPNPMAMLTLNGVPGAHIYPGKPASDGQGPTPHFAVKGKLEDAMKRCANAGGRVLSPIITIPPGRFVYTQDIDGNSIALFETPA